MSIHEGVTDAVRAALVPEPGRLVVRNEFAVVAVTVRQDGAGEARLRIEDLRTRQSVDLDALELESLAWSRHQDLDFLLDPSRTRWIDGDDTDHGRNHP
ncbi:hypothetical protein [Pseudonocardia spinosispora]|uniref:hypothetical protein n=1 Tax=Pseudonocardia spinosispora TaxID=103441 RepID=UPI00041385FA|nr:hypothetical protein [Pseudonocardia spinosispora]